MFQTSSEIWTFFFLGKLLHRPLCSTKDQQTEGKRCLWCRRTAVCRDRGLLHCLQQGKGKIHESHFAFLTTDNLLLLKSNTSPIQEILFPHCLDRGWPLLMWLILDIQFSVCIKRKDWTNKGSTKEMWFISDVLMVCNDSEGPLQTCSRLWCGEAAGGKKRAKSNQTVTPDPCHFSFYSITKAREMRCDTMNRGHGEVTERAHT